MSTIKALKSVVKVATAPSVVVPSKLTELERMALEAKGQYGAKRVQKAADEIKGLEHQFDLQALRDAFLGDNAKALMVGKPSQFQNFAARLNDPYRPAIDEYLSKMAPGGGGASDVPYLSIDKPTGESVPIVTGHEGRHRNLAMERLDYPSTLWQFLPRASLREPLPRRSQEEYINALRQELGNPAMVFPEGVSKGARYDPNMAPLFMRKLPEPFADGGAVKKLIEETKGTSDRYDPMRAQRVSEYEKGFRDFLAAQQEARESLFRPSPTVGGMAKGAAGALAGYAAQVPGIAGDILSLYEDFKPDRAPNLPEWARALPTTERLQEYYLPENASPELRAGVTGGNLFALGQGVAALPKVVAGGARMAGRGARALAPTANQMLENYMLKTGQMLPLNVYHGSPHRFAPTPKNPLGEFDPTKIGTGEGAQSYGHGHYLAENPNVANNYRNMLSGTIVKDFEGKIIETGFHNDTARAATFLAENGGDFGKAIKKINDSYPGFAEPVLKKLEYLRNAGAHVEKGSLYKVDLPDEQIAKMLDWDKPLSEQAEVIKALKGTDYEVGMSQKEAEKIADARLRQEAEEWAEMTGGDPVDHSNNVDWEKYVDQVRKESGSIDSSMTGKDLHKIIMRDEGYRPELFDSENYQIGTSEILRQFGVPGIKYLDQASRGAGEGTRNFVVFPGGESMLNIISREKKGGMVNEDAMRMKMMDKEIQRKAKGGEIKASPTYPGQELIGRIGQVAERLGITAAEAMKIVSEQGNSPIKAFLGELLIADPLKSAGTALQDWTSTPREVTPERPYSRLISGKGMTTRIDPRVLDVAAFGQPVASRLTGAAVGLPQAVREAAVAAYGPAATASHVVKPKGGNWLTGSVEEALKPLKSKTAGGTPMDEAFAQMQAAYPEQTTHPDLLRRHEPVMDQLRRGSAINQWVEKQLTRYVKNEMGTPEDPVRLAADAFPATKAQMLADKQKQIDKAVADMEKARAVRNFTPEMMTSSQARIRELQKEKELLELRMGLHFGPENVPEGNRYLDLGQAASHRMGYFPVEGSAKSDIAKFWEQASDARVKPFAAKELQPALGLRSGKTFLEKNPWLERLDPNTPVYKFEGEPRDLGFDHLIDELRNATNPESGLPRNLLINSKDLPKWTVPQAIEHVDKINAWRAVQRQDAAKAVREGIPVHKEYPEGYQWLSVPDLATDEKALRYATDIGCEGGWCTQGEETARQYGGGGNRLFVLHDPKGKPVVQIQVEQFGKGPLSGDALNEVEPGLFEKFLAQRDQEGGTHDMHKWLQATRPDLANRESIGQIKGILNKPPKPEYLPFVQDFVRSGQWADVGDIQNANMVRIYPDSDLAAKMKAAGKEPPTYVSQDEFTQLLKENPMKRGGAVNDDAIKMAVWNKQIQRKNEGGSMEQTPVFVNPNLQRQAAKIKSRGERDFPVMGPVELGAQVLSSVAAVPLASAYGVYKDLTSRKAGEPYSGQAAGNQAIADAMETFTYQPRTAPGQTWTEEFGKLMEASKLPPYFGHVGTPHNIPGALQLMRENAAAPRDPFFAGPLGSQRGAVKPIGSLNLQPSIAAETLRGPDVQTLDAFLNQVKGMPGITKEGLAEGLAAAQALDRSSKMSKADFEKHVAPSKYGKVDMTKSYGDVQEHLFDEAVMRVDEGYFDEKIQLFGIPEDLIDSFQDFLSSAEFDLDAKISSLTDDPQLRKFLKERGYRTGEDVFNELQEINSVLAERVAREMMIETGEDYKLPAFYETQRLVEHLKPEIDPYTYQVVGVTHPNEIAPYRHFPDTQNVVGHFRGSLTKEGVYADGDVRIPPNAFLVEEIQSDPQQGKKMKGHLHQIHATVAKAAIQHALEQGADSVYFPTSEPISYVRKASEKTKQLFRRVYDQEVVKGAIEPLKKIKGVEVKGVGAIEGEPKFRYYEVKFSPEAREQILKGKGQLAPGYKRGGAVNADAMRVAVWNKQLRKQHA